MNIEQLLQDCEEVAVKLYRLEISSGIILLNDVVQQIGDYLKQYTTINHLVDQIHKINEILQLTVETINNKDYILTADLIKYELVNKLIQIHAKQGEV